MAIVYIPSLMRHLTAGQAQVNVSGQTVGQIIEALEASYPGIKERLCSGNRLNPALSVSIDGRISRRGLLEAVQEQSEVHFLLAVAGG
jgi:molybdopterin synthase sulfur carrier subunit